MKRTQRIAVVVAGLALGAGVVGSAAAHLPQSTLTIWHQTRGCHTWSFNNGPYKASLKIQLARGATLKVIDNDVMPHRLVQVSGPKARLTSPAMNHMSAAAKIVFPKKGVYRFKTKAGEDYKNMAMMKTIGPDYVLRVTVVVS
jgi:hypothetical protein